MDDYALACFYKYHFDSHGQSPNAACPTVRDEALLACMKALGLATQASVIRSPHLAAGARGFYVAGINHTNAALSSSCTASLDSTLLAVIMLSYFENTTGTDSRSLTAWSQHVSGCAALIQLRGKEQMQRGEGRLLFAMAAGNMLSDCARAHARVPAFVAELMEATRELPQYASDPVWVILHSWMQVVDFYSDMTDGRVGDAPAVVERALLIDQELSSAFDNASTHWAFETLPAPRQYSDETGAPSYVHWYGNAFAGQQWTALRNGRIILHSVIGDTIQKAARLALLAPIYNTQLQASAKLVRDLQMDILATAPQYLGAAKPLSSQTSSGKTTVTRDHDHRTGADLRFR